MGMYMYSDFATRSADMGYWIPAPRPHITVSLFSPVRWDLGVLTTLRGVSLCTLPSNWGQQSWPGCFKYWPVQRDNFDPRSQSARNNEYASQ